MIRRAADAAAAAAAATASLMGTLLRTPLISDVRYSGTYLFRIRGDESFSNKQASPNPPTFLKTKIPTTHLKTQIPPQLLLRFLAYFVYRLYSWPE